MPTDSNEDYWERRYIEKQAEALDQLAEQVMQNARDITYLKAKVGFASSIWGACGGAMVTIICGLTVYFGHDWITKLLK